MNHWRSRDIFIFQHFIRFLNNIFLLPSQRQKFSFFFSRQSFQWFSLCLELLDQVRQNAVILEIHFSLSNSIKCCEKSASMCRFVISQLLHSLSVAINSHLLNLKKVCLFKLSDVVEHVDSSVVEVLLEIESLVDEVVHERSLLDELVLLVHSHVLDLSLGFHEVLCACEFCGVLPLVEELVGFVVREDVVEDCELGTGEHSEVLDFCVPDDE